MIKEIEAAFLGVDKDTMREKLNACGFKLITPEHLMRRKTFSFPGLQPGQKKWGRVRQESDKVTMTVKEIKGPGIQDVYETQVTVNDFDLATAFFEACGIPAKAMHESMRELWLRDNVEVTIDTWPGLKPFVEIEASTEETVRAISKELGFDFSKAVFGSADLIYEKELGIPAEEILELPEITFKNPPQK
jgi:adenylate cyclase class 2